LPLNWVVVVAVAVLIALGAFSVVVIQRLNDERQRIRELIAGKLEVDLRLRTALGAANLATWEYDLASGAMKWDGPMRAMFGLAEDRDPTIDFFFSIVHPDDRARLQQQQQMALAGDTRALINEFRVLLKDGSVRWLHIEGAFLPGLKPRAAGVARDITRRKLADEQLQLITGELKHRLRNVFAVVGSICQQTLRAAGVADEVSANIQGRLRALAGAQDLLVAGGTRGADLAVLIDAVLGPMVPAGDKPTSPRRLQIEGARVFLPPDISTSFALVLHELGTNALKYGAWSRDGFVHIAWEVLSAEAPQLRFVWREHGEPATSAPIRQGLGTALIQNAIPGATIEHSVKQSGVECLIHVALIET
jgi:two-component system, chemotaxis family, CheB/CheR fusion protein